MAKNALITGWGFYAPSRVMTNAELERIVDTTDEWITSRTGIKERRIASDEETNSFMSARAARAALEKAHLRAQDVQLVVVGTCSPDYLFPATACLVQTEIGATRAGAFDVEAACTSFITALAIARGMIVSGAIQNALVIGAERLSRLLNWKDRTTCVLFGDGAGAVVLEASNASVGIEAPGVGRHDRARPALHHDGGRRGIQARREIDGRCRRGSHRRGGAHARRHRHPDPASGQRPDHRRGREAPALPAGEGLREHPALRQHVGRLDPDRALRSRVHGAPPERRQSSVGRFRRRLHVGCFGPRMVRRSRRRPTTLTARARRPRTRRRRREGPPDLTPNSARTAAKTWA